MNRNQLPGFTLVELMLTVSIIGILAAIALPAYNDYIVRAKIVEGFSMTVEARSTVNEFYQFTGRMPTNNEEAGLAAAEAYRGNYIHSLTVENGAIHLDFDDNVTYSGKDEKIRLTLRPMSNPNAVNEELIWSCSQREEIDGLVVHGVSQTTLENKYLPANCRS